MRNGALGGRQFSFSMSFEGVANRNADNQIEHSKNQKYLSKDPENTDQQSNVHRSFPTIETFGHLACRPYSAYDSQAWAMPQFQGGRPPTSCPCAGPLEEP